MQEQTTDPTRFKGALAVVKLSGKALADEERLVALFKSLKDAPVVFVHGGGVEVDELFLKLHLEVKKQDGLRVSPKEQIPYISAALCGMCNKRLQSLALSAGHKALGLLCSDGGSLMVSQLDPKLGQVGAVECGQGAFLNTLLQEGFTPLLATLCFDPQGIMYNVNADDAALGVARTLGAPLYYISDVPGVLNAQGELIPTLDEHSAHALIADGTIAGGMVVKVKSALQAASLLKRRVCIASYKEQDLGAKILKQSPVGTVF
ncbi:MAG: acetylglutamate kinase [Succinivibrio sp.]|nr:acetylglutamate kinase [Succinivibrio sp.]